MDLLGNIPRDLHCHLFSWIFGAEEFGKPAKVTLHCRPNRVVYFSIPEVVPGVQINIGELGRYDGGKYSLRNNPRCV